jgi:hypothetical protein
MMILVVIQRLIGAPLARVGKTQDSRVKSQESRLKSRNPHSMYEAIGGQRPPKEQWPQATKTPPQYPPLRKSNFKTGTQ